MRRSPKGMRFTYPEDTDGVVRAVRRTVRLDHAEHAVQLPVDEEDDEKVVSVPEAVEVGTAALLHREPDHDPERGPHDPASHTGTGREVGHKEGDDTLTGCLRVRVDHGKICEIDHVGASVDSGEEDDGPGDGFVERDILVEGDEVVQRGASQEGDEVAANGKEDEYHVHMKNQSRRTGNG